MKTLDLHGMKVDAAVDLFNNYVTTARQSNREIIIRFITGQGDIRQAYIRLCRDYDLDYFDYDLGNLVITFE